MKNTYINLPIRNVRDTDIFFDQLGFKKNEAFASDDTTNISINDTSHVMLLEDARFESFIDSRPSMVNTSSIIGIEYGTKDEVDVLFENAINAGATDTTKPAENDFMYGKSFQDINGHRWECFVFTKTKETKK